MCLMLLLFSALFLEMVIGVQISTCTELNGGNGNYWNQSITLTQNIDCTGINFVPIGGQTRPFQGSFDGQNFVISNLAIGKPGQSWVGLFGATTSTGTIANLRITQAVITGSRYIGILIGNAMGGGTVINVHVEGKVIATSSEVGGLVGSGWTSRLYSSSASVDVIVNYEKPDSGDSNAGIGGLAGSMQGTVSNSFSKGTVTVNNSFNVGGLVGYHASGNIYNSYSIVDVIGNWNNTGGLLGYSSGTVRACYATGSVQGVNNTGGLIGEASRKYCSVSDCYATGAVTGSQYATGGLIGMFDNGYDSPNITRTYATGLVSGEYQTGGLVGLARRVPDSALVNSSYWDVETTAMEDSAAGEGKDTSEMHLQATYQGWDFKSVWAIGEGESYPYLQNMP